MLSTTTACYTTAAAISTACSGKKKRSIWDNPIDGTSEVNPVVAPSRTGRLGQGVERQDKSLALSKLDELNQVRYSLVTVESKFMEPTMCHTIRKNNQGTVVEKHNKGVTKPKIFRILELNF